MPEWTGSFAGPGLYPGLPEDLYHADVVPEGSLSVSGAKLLLPPSCPALFDYARRHPHAPTKAMELGTVVHGMVLGTGQDVVILDYADYKTKKAQEDKKSVIASGSVPMLPHEHAEAKAIAATVAGHDIAGGLFADGDAEVSMFWRDPDWDIWLRSRMDYLTYIDGQPVIPDLKTTADASPQEFARSAAKFRYQMQDPWYRDGLAAMLGCDPGDIDFLFCVVQVTAPYLVMTYRLDAQAVELGSQMNAIAREKYRDCAKADHWPAWSDDIEDLELPRYAVSQIERDISDYYA